MPDHDRYTDAGGADGKLGQLENLARLRPQLGLFVELLAVELPIHFEVAFGRILGAEALHALCACAGRGLVGREPDPGDSDRVVQGLQHAREWDRGAVRVGDDAVMLERPLTVHLGDDERDPILQPVGRGLVDRDSASAYGVGDELAACRGPDREQADVEIAGAQSLGRRLLDGQTVELLSG